MNKRLDYAPPVGKPTDYVEGAIAAPAPRLVRCPTCRGEFETPRRWQLACPECGNEWDEENHYKAGQDLRTDIPQYLVLGFLWAGALAIVAVILGFSGYFSWWLFEKDPGAALGVAALFAVASVCMVVIYPRNLRAFCAPSIRVVSWFRGLVGQNIYR